MNKIIRNTIILSSLWVLILIIGIFYIYGYQKGSLKKLTAEKEKKSERLVDLRALNQDLSELKNYYEHLKELNMKYTGTLASFVSPGETFDYIRRELATTNSSVKLNMVFKEEKNFKSMMKRTYELKGSGDFRDIYDLLWFLERGPVFYSLKSVRIEQISEELFANKEKVKQKDEATFDITIIGYDRTQGPKITEINRNFGQPKKIANLFVNKNLPKVKTVKPAATRFAAITNTSRTRSTPALEPSKPIVKNTDGLPEISSSSEVLGLTPFSVLVKDEKGKIVKLYKGDKIFGGNLADLNPQAGQVTFVFNNQFGNKTVTLTLKK